MMRGMPPRMLWHGWEKPSGRAAVGAEARALALIFLCALNWAAKPVCYAALPMMLAAGAALIRLSVPLQRCAGYLPWAVPLGVLLMALWLYMDIRHGRKGFRAWVHRVLMAAAVMFFALAWMLRAGILTGQITL